MPRLKHIQILVDPAMVPSKLCQFNLRYRRVLWSPFLVLCSKRKCFLHVGCVLSDVCFPFEKKHNEVAFALIFINNKTKLYLSQDVESGEVEDSTI